MKNLLILYLVLGYFSSYGQVDDVLRIDSLPAEGVLLDARWKWQKGDNPEWAKAGFDDRNWNRLNPSATVLQLSEIVPKGIVWLRLKFEITNSLKKKVSVCIEQSGASQIFLNGKKIKEYGVVGNGSQEVTAYNPLSRPLVLDLDTEGIQTLAVRYAFQAGINYKPILEVNYPFFKAKLVQSEMSSDNYKPGLPMFIQSFIAGLFVMLFIFHIILFFFYRSSNSNLYLSLYALLIVIAAALHIKLLSTNIVADRNLNSVVMLVINNISVLPIAYSFYFLLKRKSKYAMYAVILVMSISTGNSIFGSYTTFDLIQFISLILVSSLYVVLAISAYRQEVNGAIFLAVGIVLSILLNTLLFTGIVFGFDGDIIGILWLLSQIVFPISISLVLGLEFKFINQSLKNNLRIVKKLSEEKEKILASQKEALEQQVRERTSELNHSLENLKATQLQLIQSEKMASLGELTAGIAHEIQNPLNFVNNFSEVNKELLVEMKDEIDKGNLDEAKVIANDVIENEGKIIHHGKRADDIVKGMLQHSRSSTGVKEPTDINALADEYLHLAYHGMRAKHKSFNATLKTDYDATIGKVDIIPQDIGRVILNLINNALYAVNEKNLSAVSDQPAVNYEPTVIISTKKVGDKVQLSVSDNGNGIPQNLLDKIFQPFFTTKPTGQGTGLGLSLSYDIVKAHGGLLTVKSNAAGPEVDGLTYRNEVGTTFEVLLPIMP
jgi:signal transduction histidine kinase